MHQIAVRGVQFEHVVFGGQCALRGLAKRVDDARYLVGPQGPGHGVGGVERRVGWRDRLPAALLGRHTIVAFPRPLRAALASRVRDLGAGEAALCVHEPDDAASISTWASR